MTQTVPHELDTQLGTGWESKLMGIYGAGGSDAEVSRSLNITMGVFSRLYQAYPLFEEYVNKGRSDARAWFEELGRKGLIKANGDLNHQLWTTIMSNRFGYSTKPVDNDDKPPSMMSDDEINQKLAAKIAKAQPIVASRAPD